jgi:Zn-dependent M16 (insulinase) family peptidase
MDNNVKKIIDSLALGDKEEADSAFKDLMRNKVKDAVDTKTIEVADKVYNVTESVNTEDDTEDALYEEAIDAILEDGDITISEMSDEELEKILEDRFNTLNDSLLKKIGKGIASRVTVSGRADRAAKKAEKGEKKIADRAKLMKAKATIRAQKALRKAQKAAKRAGKPVPRGYTDAGIEDPEVSYKKAIEKAKAKVEQ